MTNSEHEFLTVSFVVRTTGTKADRHKIRQQCRKLFTSKLAKQIGQGIELDSRLGPGGFYLDESFTQSPAK